ncbi:MAG: M20/M25/M40 family metallo-hydrolase [Ignavibacteria bacterium]|nr:M20/M25/M40 family metallo-hydrolase [Ignavibacteria bacterium]
MIDFLLDIMRFDSTSGKENELAEYISQKYKPADAELEIHKTEFGRSNIFFKWGNPKVIFNSHLDTVPPYISPLKENDIIKGRGSCDAKGQLAYLFEACLQLRKEGYSDFGMLMTAGEEDGSQGAMAANKLIKDCDFIIIGEPTENKLISASKGNICADFVFKGKSCHSGYPHLGDSATERMYTFIHRLKEIDFGEDEILGRTMFNVGMLESKNAHNVVSDLVTMKVFFRTTFVSHDVLTDRVKNILDEKSEMNVLFRHRPMKFFTTEGFETGTVAYGTDAPSFNNVKNIILYGPGSILDAHTEHEFIKISDMHKAVEDIKRIYKTIS